MRERVPLLAEGRYFGRCDISRNAGCLILSECAYAPGLRIPRHSHENPYLVFTLSGGQEELTGSRRQSYVPTTLAFHPAGETHSESIGPAGMRCLHVEFRPEWLRRHAEVSKVLTRGSQSTGGPLGWLAHKIYREFSDMDDFASSAIEGLALEILASASRLRNEGSSRELPRWLAQARDLIRARFTESLSLTDIATAVQIHPVHLSRQFLRHYRCTVADYIRQLRIASACKTISTTDRPLADIAAKAGFSDQAHFTRVCKRLAGRTPPQFRGPAKQR